MDLMITPVWYIFNNGVALILEKDLMLTRKVTCMAGGRVCTEKERSARGEDYSARSWVEVVACDAPARAPGFGRCQDLYEGTLILR